MAMKNRFVKRIVRKIIPFTITISIMATLITMVIVEKRINKQYKLKSSYGEYPSAPSFLIANDESVLRRHRPSVRQKHFDDRDQAMKRNDSKINKDDIEDDANTSDVELFQIPLPTGPLRDWHDYKAIEKDKQRTGMGEHGKPSFIKDESLKELEDLLSRHNGFNALLSDYISVNRSVPDVRQEDCETKQYLAKLPTVSVVIPVFNEHVSVLQRTMHSIKNRSPPELLKQIILVDDFSDREYSHKQLENYVVDNFPGLVSVVRLPKRRGLMGARMMGAKQATGQILVFLDSHIEVNVNWLPPLIEPIVLNPKIVTCPVIDSIKYDTFEYKKCLEDNSRGFFKWESFYIDLPVLPILPEDAVDKTKPFKNPIMAGGLFAIGYDFFWELGGYDEGLEIWGAEQYELSFKIWMCGGMMFDVPCSRAAHLYRKPFHVTSNPIKYKYLAKNQKRVAEVWMDEYKNYLYERNPDVYEKIDAGDLTKQKAVRERLKCKPFKWFMEVVAPDIFKVYSPLPDYATGRVQNVAYEYLCLDGKVTDNSSIVKLLECDKKSTVPHLNQHWSLSGHHDMRLFRSYNCLTVNDAETNSTILIDDCHNQGDNQFWYYDRMQQWLVNDQDGELCMEAIVDGDESSVVLNTCDATNKRMKWRFDFVNHTALDNFFKDLSTELWMYT